MTSSPNDHFVVTYQQGERPDRWTWEIRRKSKPLGIKMTGDGYPDSAARFAGKQALADFCPIYWVVSTGRCNTLS